MLKNTFFCILFSICTSTCFAITPQAKAFSSCIESNLSSQNKDTLLKWAYVALSKTRAAKSVQTIPESKVRKVELEAQSALSRILIKHCAKEGAKLAFADPKNGLQDSLTLLAESLIKKEIQRHTGPLLPLTITELLMNPKK